MIQLRALNIAKFIENPSIASKFNDSEQALLLLLIKNSCTEGPAAAINWCTDPESAFTLLTKQYSHSSDVQRTHLYPAFYQLNFIGYKGTLESFNASFNSYLSRLQILGSYI